MGQILPCFWSNENVTYTNDHSILSAARKIAKSDNVDKRISVMSYIVYRRRSNYQQRCTRYTDMTALVIACINYDTVLAERLIKKGADVNLYVNGVDVKLYVNGVKHLGYEHKVTPLYCAAVSGAHKIVKMLIDAGADMNASQGLKQEINLQIHPDFRAILDPCLEIDFVQTDSCHKQMVAENFYTILHHYLEAGIKLNTTSWGPCLFMGRGKVFEANTPTTLDIDGPWFICRSSVILLQHGVDSNLYRLQDVLYQIISHCRYRYLCNRNSQECRCLSNDLLVEVFLASGYKFTDNDTNFDIFNKKESRKEIYDRYGPLTSLKHLCRTRIRQNLLLKSEDTSIFRAIDCLELPGLLKDYLKLNDIVPSDLTSYPCLECQMR